MKNIIKTINLKKTFDKHNVLNGVNLTIYQGESYVIIGPSGTGKSVLIKSILGLLHADDGSIQINGQEITQLTRSKMMKIMLQCGVLFQGAALFDSMSVLENAAFGLVYGKNYSKYDAYKIAGKKLDAVSISKNVWDRLPSEISGGMQKRVALARALATEPKIIFFDEPTTGLDPITGESINKLIVKCNKEFGISALTITHDLHSLNQIADRVGLLFDGKIVWEGKKEELYNTDNEYVQQFVNGRQNGPFATSAVL